MEVQTEGPLGLLEYLSVNAGCMFESLMPKYINVRCNSHEQHTCM